jgi:hypothetical protein
MNKIDCWSPRCLQDCRRDLLRGVKLIDVEAGKLALDCGN